MYSPPSTNTNTNTNITKYFYYIFFIAALFPYITIIDLRSDVQPYSFIIALLILPAVWSRKIPALSYWLFITLCVAFFYAIVEFSFTSIRAFYGYISFITVFFVSYFSCKRFGLPPIRIIYITFTIWIIAGLIQLYYDPNFFHAILPREVGYAGRHGRGIESLTAEPTFYGFMLLICSLFVFIYSKKNKKIPYLMIFLILFQIFFMSRSSSAILTLSLSTICWFFLSANLKNKIISILFIIIFYALISYNLEVLGQLRIYQLLNALITDPKYIILADTSLNDRLFHIFYSIYGFFENFLLPHGFVSWWDYIQEKSRYNPLAINVTGSHGRVMSYIGGVLFELGIFSIPIFIVIYTAISRFFPTMSLKISIYFFITLLLLQSVPLSLPTLPMILGIMLASSQEKEHYP